MKKVSRLLFSSELAALAFFLLTSGAKAAPIQWAAADGGNDHYYDFVLAPDISWHAARDAAASLSFLGSQGHLVTVTSAAEDTFLRTNFSSQIGDPRPPPDRPIVVPGLYAWIGLTDEITEGDYRWVTGEPFSFSVWGMGEPSGFDFPDQDYINLWRRDYGSGPMWSWDDTIASPPLVGYGSFLVEFDGPFVQVVPAPGAFSLLTVGSLSLLGYMRRRVTFRRG